MKRVDRYITSDNIEHATKEKAIKHADKRISDQVYKIADKIYPDTRNNIVDYIMDNLAEFQKLIDLENDKQLESEE